MGENTPTLKNLAEALHYLGSQTGGYKKLCCAICLEHADDPDEAQKKVARKLSKKSADVFSNKDMNRAIAWGHDRDCHILKWWQDDLQSYARSAPIYKKSELVKQMDRYADLTRQAAECQARVEELQAEASDTDAGESKPVVSSISQ